MPDSHAYTVAVLFKVYNKCYLPIIAQYMSSFMLCVVIYGLRREKTCLLGGCEQQRRRPACAYTHSDQRLYY